MRRILFHLTVRCALEYVRRQWLARPLAVFSVCFLLGMIHGEALRLSAVFALLLAGFLLALHFGLKKKHVCLALLPMLAAFLLGDARMLAALDANPPVRENFSVCFEGTVVSDPGYNASKDRIICVLKLNQVDGRDTQCSVRLYLRSDVMPLEGIEYGQRLSCFGHVWPQDAATNPFQYDGMKGLRAKGLAGMAAAKLEDVQVLSTRSTGPGALRIQFWHAVSDRIDALFPENADLVRAFVLGDRTGLEENTRTDFSRTGVAHLICISGLHISVLAMAVSKLLSRLFSRRASVYGTLAAVLTYGYLIGFPASFVRAMVMFTVYAFAPIAGMPSDAVTRLSAALLLMLIIRPFNLYDGGFVLSFSASAGILLLTEPIEMLFGVDRLKKMKPHPRKILRMGQRLIRYFPQLLCTTLAAQLATLPAVIRYFGAQPLISIPVNLIAIPLAMAAYPLSLIALMLSAICMPLGQGIALASDFAFGLLLKLIHAFAELPAGSIRSPCFPVWLIYLHALLVLLSSGLNRIAARIRRFLPLALTLLIGVSMLNAWIHALEFSVVFLDAGQADSAVIRAEGHVYVCDAGDLYSPLADYAAGSCLGVDAVFLSHPHSDHAAGLAELLEKMPPKVIYLPEGWDDFESSESVAAGIEAAQQLGIPIIELSAGDEVQLGKDMICRVYSPWKSVKSANDVSLLLEFSSGGNSVLFTGDISKSGEPELLPDVDILKVPHHGSDTACSEALLSAASPEVAIISVGENSYGHPSGEVLERLSDSGSEIYRTDQCGAITVRFDHRGNIHVETYLPVEVFE